MIRLIIVLGKTIKVGKQQVIYILHRGFIINQNLVNTFIVYPSFFFVVLSYLRVPVLFVGLTTRVAS